MKMNNRYGFALAIGRGMKKWGFFLLTSMFIMQFALAGKSNGFQGEYFITQNREPTICEPFTKNLNQFRKLDFDACHPRLSEKYPQYSRPEWEETPFNMELAEKIIKGPYPEHAPQRAQYFWQQWLAKTENFRKAGKVKMWRTHIDVDGDGNIETIVRLDYAQFSLKPIEQLECRYRNGVLYMTESVNPDVSKEFNKDRRANDIIYDDRTKHYYLIEWGDGPTGPGMDGMDIGATRSVTVFKIYTHPGPIGKYLTVGPVDICEINWVPTGHYRPLKRSHR